MKKWIFATALSALVLGCSSVEQAKPIPLFNGQDLSGWTIVNNGQFSVEDGHLKINRGTGWLRSNDTYGDYVLTMRFRFLEEKANSGVFVRTQSTSKSDANGWPDKGYQVQTMDTVEGIALGHIIPYGAPDFTHQTDNEALIKAYKPTGQWNEFEITAQGEKLNIKVNGVVVTKVQHVKQLTGHIGIQGERGLLEFSDISILPL